MKRILLLVGLLGLLGFLMATPGPDHKVFWCHYPPGQWTGVTGDASHVLILSIDVAAEPGHLGHSPSLSGGPTCDPTTFNGASAVGCAEGVTLTGDESGCPGVGPPSCAAQLACTLASGSISVCGPEFGSAGGPTSYPLTQGPIDPFTVTGCVCPLGTPNQGRTPIPFTPTSGTVTLSCGSAG